MKMQPTIAHGFKTHTIACVFHDFEGFQEMTKIMKRHKTIVCRLSRFLKNFKKRLNHEKTTYYSSRFRNTYYSLCFS